jgi:CRP/FNR family transcriptional regulator
MKETVISLDRLRQACKECSLAMLCLPVGLSSEDTNRLSAILQTNRIYHRGDMLFRHADRFAKLYVVKSGSVKSFTEHAETGEQILGFHLPGEVVGLDGIAEDAHLSSAMALETTACCEIPFARLEKLTTHVPSLQHHIYRLMSKEIAHESQMLTLLGRFNAEQRLAAFLVSISGRAKQRGLSATEFQLSMSRSEIGNYLGLAVETISRLFRKFQEQGLVQADRKRVTLLDRDRLAAMIEDPEAVCLRNLL